MSTQPAWWKSTEAMVAGILLLAMVLIGLVNPAFWSLENLFSLARSNIVIGIMALGVLLVMISGGIDVSFPAFAAAAAYLVVRAMVDWGWPTGVLIPFVLATLLGAAMGLVNATLVWKLRMIPLIVTLGTAAALIEGVELTLRELKNVFAKHGITVITPELGEKFDPQRHEAMFEAPVPGTVAGSIIQVMDNGFMLHDRLLRPAKVGVSSMPAS